MSVEISIVKSPNNVQNTKVCQVFTERGGSIGRGEDNTWVIEDPERFISSQHTLIIFENGQYYLSDLSTNGTFLNGSSEPIGNGNRVLLKNGDRFTLSEYEFLVSMRSGNGAGFADSPDPFDTGSFANNAPMQQAVQSQFDNSFPDYDDPFSGQSSLGSLYTDPLVSSGFEETDPLAALDKVSRNNQRNPFLNAVEPGNQPDNADPLQQAVAWPNAIPDDWDQDETPVSHVEVEAPQQPKQPKKPNPKRTTDKALQEKLQKSELQREALEIENQQLLSDVMQLKQKLKNLQTKSVPQKVSGPSTPGDETLLEAMGLGSWNLSEQKKSEISAAVGLLMRETIAGLMQALSFRKKIKEEFRINVTTIQPVENNPLKFSANIEDALENMFIKDNKAYMKPLDSVKESFQGISEHQVAVLAGIQAAFRGMIERLDPEALEKRFEKYRKTGVIKVGQKGKNWESYKEFHQDLVNNIDNSFQYLFGYDFVQAYEEQLQRLVMIRKAKTKN